MIARLLAALAAALFAALPVPSHAEQTQSLLGIWSYATHYPIGVSGPLIVERSDGGWRATIGGATASAPAGESIEISFPDGGRFRGTYRRGVLSGFWARRAVVEDPLFPFGEALAYAAPLALKPAGRGRWIAQVSPLDDSFTLYLRLFRDADGRLKAAFRNPEQNSYGPAMQLDAALSGDTLTLSAPGKPALVATLLTAPDRLSIVWPDLKRRIELTRAGPAVAARFFPRDPGTHYAYRPPARRDDGWSVARAGSLGVDEAALTAAVQRIIDRDPAGPRPWLIHSLAIAYRGRLILDEYFYGAGPDDPHDLRSASKTFSSVILGAMMRDGSALSPASRVYPIMAPRGPFANPDPRKADITLGHLLTHSAGLACDDNAERSPGNEDMMEADLTQPDWTKRTLDLPMAYKPGEHYAYCSMNINLAGAVLSQASGEWLPALFDRTVARPLQFGPWHWNLTGSGEGYLGGGAFVRPRDFLKLGQAYLNGGVWNGRRLVSTAWVTASFSPHMRISPATTGLSGDAFVENYYEVDEGWAWHMIGVKAPDRIWSAFHANGNGGQLLVIVPELDLAVMFTAGNYGQGLWNRERDDILGALIIPAIAKARATR